MAHVIKPRANARIIRPSQRTFSSEIDVVIHHHKIAHGKLFIDAARGIGQNHLPHPKCAEYDNRIGNLGGRIALIAVQAPLHTQHGFTRKLTTHQASRMVGCSRLTEVGHVTERNCNRLFQFICQWP